MCAEKSGMVAGVLPLLRHLGKLWREAARADSADDLAQDFAVRLLERAHAFDPARFSRSSDPWAVFVRLNAKTEALDQGYKRRSASRRPMYAHQAALVDRTNPDGPTVIDLVADHREATGDDDGADRERERRLRRVAKAVAKLPERQRVAVRRRYGLDADGIEHSYASIDPTRERSSNRDAVERGLAAVRRGVGAGLPE